MIPQVPPVSRRVLPDGVAVAPWLAPDGWPLRSFAYPAAASPKGSLLFLGGRGDFFEKYLEAFHVWRTTGWNVAGFDWRGQGGSGVLHPRGYCHVNDFAVFVGDLAAYCAEWCARTPGPHIAIGHSMGGHVLLRVLTEQRVELDAAILLAPMLGIRAGTLTGKPLHTIAAIGRIPPFRARPIWTGPRSPAPGRVTSCPERQADKLWWKAERPEVGRGAPTWGWLAAAMRSITVLERTLRRSPPAVPGLILTAGNDPIVDAKAIRRALRSLPGFEHGLIPHAGHEMLRERDELRFECLARIDRFLARVVAAR